LTLRVAHISDVHWTSLPGVRQLPFKRALGTANLYLGGRRHHFSSETRAALMEHILTAQPDLLVFSGDITAQALDSEFEMAKTALSPILETIPTFIIPGNHDVYTWGAQKTNRVHKHFGQWMYKSDDIQMLADDRFVVIGLDPNRPHLILSSGRVPKAQLLQLAHILEGLQGDSRPVILAIHYPILCRRGSIYNGLRHGLLNAQALIDVLDAAPRQPDIILHGHEHHGYTVDLPLSGRPVPIFNCGSSGYAYMPDLRRAGATNIYSFQSNEITQVERFMFDGTAFTAEKGGAYSTGR